jgi:hypothetical protein
VAEAPVKLVIENYRTLEMAPPLRQLIENGFSPLWGNIRIYGPAIDPGEQMVLIRFDGTYNVDVYDGQLVLIDGRLVRDGASIPLHEGFHTVDSESGARLRLRLPACEAAADPRFREPFDMFPNIYGY